MINRRPYFMFCSMENLKHLRKIPLSQIYKLFDIMKSDGTFEF